MSRLQIFRVMYRIYRHSHSPARSAVRAARDALAPVPF